jgi:hypothetical protein
VARATPVQSNTEDAAASSLAAARGLIWYLANDVFIVGWAD